MSIALTDAARPSAIGPAASRLLAGPGLSAGAEPLAAHVERLAPRPRGGPWLLEVLRQSGLGGKGGAGFPVGRKWEGIAEAARAPVIVVNGSEGEPLSAKDALLLEARPHLVLDGAALAAETLGSDEVFVYLSQGRPAKWRAVRQALRERGRARLGEPAFRVVATEHRYVAGESSAAAQKISGGPSKPRFTPPRTSERGVFGRPTLVQNVETLAHVALIARRGAAWFREAGTPTSPGTTLMTVLGNVRRPGVYEVDLGLRIGGVLELAGGAASHPAGALLGGYFGTWLGREALLETPLAADELRGRGAALGCGVLALLPEHGCGIIECARITAYLARESAGQCGPCVHGLAALADTMDRVASSRAVATDVDRLLRWASLVEGRGACSHPDGAVRQLRSGLSAFAGHLPAHLAGEPCAGAHGFPQPPRSNWWAWQR